MKSNLVLDGLMGLCVGDALGLAHEGSSRKLLSKKPVTTMNGYGAHNQPPGTWSDDSSLTFCLAESLCRGYDLNNFAEKICAWLYEGYWTPFGQAFGIGATTWSAINKLKGGVSPLESGETGEYSNGNGSLMRILPIAFYLIEKEEDYQFKVIHQLSSITHRHIRSQMSCGIYIQLAICLIKKYELKPAIEEMKRKILKYYSKGKYRNEINVFSRILKKDIFQLKKDNIYSSGYVVDTLEASLWSLLNNNSYKDTVLTAVNLGGDTDTTAAVTGGLAGIYYGLDNIPAEWIKQIVRNEDIIDLSDRLNQKLA